MTDQQLLDAGERLYNAFLGSNFTFLELAGLAAARERRTAWPELGQNLKLAVFRLVVLSQPAEVTAPPPADPLSDGPQPAAPLVQAADPGAVTANSSASQNEHATNATEAPRISPIVDPADGDNS